MLHLFKHLAHWYTHYHLTNMSSCLFLFVSVCLSVYVCLCLPVCVCLTLCTSISLFWCLSYLFERFSNSAFDRINKNIRLPPTSLHSHLSSFSTFHDLMMASYNCTPSIPCILRSFAIRTASIACWRGHSFISRSHLQILRRYSMLACFIISVLKSVLNTTARVRTYIVGRPRAHTHIPLPECWLLENYPPRN